MFEPKRDIKEMTDRQQATYFMGASDALLQAIQQHETSLSEWANSNPTQMRLASDEKIESAAERELRERPPQNPNASKPLNLTREERQSLIVLIEYALIGAGLPDRAIPDIRRIFLKLTGVSLGVRKGYRDMDPHFLVDASEFGATDKAVSHIDGHEVDRPTKKVQFPNQGIDQ